MLPSVDSLRCFVEAARLLNFRAAAKVVALTPAALGQRIRQLEDQVGAPLFRRNSRHCALTEAGLSLLPHAHATVDAAGACLRAGRGELEPPATEVVLGTRHELGMSWLVPMLPRLRAAHPNLTVHLYFGSGADLLIRVRTLEVQCAVGSMRVHDPRIDSERLHPEQYVLVASRKRLTHTPLRRREDASAHPLVDLNPELPLFAYWRDAPEGGPLPFARVLWMGTTAAVRQLVLDGEGVAVLPRYLVAADLRAGRLVPLLKRVTPLEDHFRLFFRGDDPRRSVYEALAGVMRSQPLR
jgi:LysR family glycine cleavage system transcriptional activator